MDRPVDDAVARIRRIRRIRRIAGCYPRRCQGRPHTRGGRLRPRQRHQPARRAAPARPDRQAHARAAAGASRHGGSGQLVAADVRELRHREDRTHAMRRRQRLLRLHGDYPHCKTTMAIRIEAVNAWNMKTVVPWKRLLWPQAVGYIQPSCDQTGSCRLPAVSEWRRAARSAVQAQRS